MNIGTAYIKNTDYFNKIRRKSNRFLKRKNNKKDIDTNICSVVLYMQTYVRRIDIAQSQQTYSKGEQHGKASNDEH